ncbi:MAG: DUF4093 domain-containing protein [Oscillospiraceae bacterium]
MFKNKEKQELFRTLAKTKGLAVLTDSDVAGFKIRSFLRNICKDGSIIDVYIPDLYGKEKRKAKPSKEGKLGVEGISPEILLEAFSKAGVGCDPQAPVQKQITKMDFFEDGLSGSKDSSIKRSILIKKLALPEHLSSNSLLTVLNALLGYDEYKRLINSEQ